MNNLNKEEIKTVMELANSYMEYVKATVDINNQQDRIQSIVNKAVENGIKIPDVSDHFTYRKDHGLYYRSSAQSSYFAVQVKQDPPSFSEAINELLSQDYSYQDIKDFFEQLTNDANDLLTSLPKLEENIDLAIEDKHWKYNNQQNNIEVDNSKIKNNSFKEYLQRLEDVLKKNGIQRCYCADKFKDNVINRLYLVPLPDTVLSKEFYDVLSEKRNDYSISLFMDRNVDMDWYTLYTSNFGLNYSNIDFDTEKENLNENDSIDKSESDEYEL